MNNQTIEKPFEIADTDELTCINILNILNEIDTNYLYKANQKYDFMINLSVKGFTKSIDLLCARYNLKHPYDKSKLDLLRSYKNILLNRDLYPRDTDHKSIQYYKTFPSLSCISQKIVKDNIIQQLFDKNQYGAIMYLFTTFDLNEYIPSNEIDNIKNKVYNYIIAYFSSDHILKDTDEDTMEETICLLMEYPNLDKFIEKTKFMDNLYDKGYITCLTNMLITYKIGGNKISKTNICKYILQEQYNNFMENIDDNNLPINDLKEWANMFAPNFSLKQFILDNDLTNDNIKDKYFNELNSTTWID